MIDCRGRNGWFNMAEASVSVFRNGTAAIRVSSKSPYRDMPPIYLSGPLQEIKDLLEDLQAQLIAEAAVKNVGCELEAPLNAESVSLPDDKENGYATLVGRD